MKSSSSIIRAGDTLSRLEQWAPVEFEQDQLFSNEMIYASAINFFGIKPGEIKDQKKNLVKADQGEVVFQSWQPGDMNLVNSNIVEEDVATTSWAPFLEQPNPRKIADQIILDAKAQAESIINSANATIDQIKQDAYNKGIESAKAEMRESLQAAASVINVAREWRVDMMSQAEPMIMDLVKKMAQKMFGDGVQLDNAALQQHFASVMESARSLGDLRVYMNPADAMLLGPDWREYQASMLGNKVEIASNDSIKQGGCYIQGEWGTADALVETQLAAILNQFSEVEQPDKGDD
jgi:flagellar assembly protein FliH